MRFLRGHHLICLHFFKGEGYDDAFVNNLISVLKDVSMGRGRIVEGADDVCRACPYLREGMCSYKEGEKEIKRLDELALNLLGVHEGEVVEWNALKERLRSIFPDWTLRACSKCDWRNVCRATELWKSLSN